MEKKDRDFLYKLESYTRDLAVNKYQNKRYEIEKSYSYNHIEEILNNCTGLMKWILKEHLKVIWKIATLEAELSTLYYGEFLRKKELKEKIEYLKKECLVIKDISERSSKEEPEDIINIEAVQKGYEYLKDILKQQEEWIERNPSKAAEFKEKLEITKTSIKELEDSGILKAQE